MGKKPDNEKHTKPKETEDDKLLKQVKKPLKKLMKLYGPEKTKDMLQQLITSIEANLEVKAAKDKIEKEAKVAKRAIDRKTREALAALSKAHAMDPRPEAEQTEEEHQPPLADSPESKDTPVSDTFASEAPPAEEKPEILDNEKGTNAKSAANQAKQAQD